MTFPELDRLVEEMTSPAGKCTGLVFRGLQSCYIDNNGNFTAKEGFRLLKRKSCSCERCCGLLSFYSDDISEHLNYGGIDWPHPVQDGKLYGLKCLESTGWESGIPEFEGFEFYLLPKEPSNDLK